MKHKKLRGSNTAGRGAGDRSRSGAGRRGGRGKAGGGKRGQQKLMSFHENRHAPEERHIKKIPLNLNRIQFIIEKLKKDGKLVYDGDRIVLHLDELGFSKVCGGFKGEKMKLVVYGKASAKAEEDIKAGGGEVRYE